MDYKKISQDVVDHVGGISNIKGATHCVTRLRLILNDETKYDRKALENIEGVKGVLFNSGQLMIIFGTGTVNNVYDAFIELTFMSYVRFKQRNGSKTVLRNSLWIVEYTSRSR